MEPQTLISICRHLQKHIPLLPIKVMDFCWLSLCSRLYVYILKHYILRFAMGLYTFALTV